MQTEKSKDCSIRSQLNFLVANQWSYGLGSSTPPPPGTPHIAIDRPGAFPQALESAIRIRNLERILNEPPKSNVNLNRVQELSHKSATIRPLFTNEQSRPFGQDTAISISPLIMNPIASKKPLPSRNSNHGPKYSLPILTRV